MTISTRSCARAAAALTLSTLLAACSAGPAATVSGESRPAPQAGPAGAVAPSPADVSTFTGVVAETMNSGGYTYVKLEEGGETVWAAAMEFPVKTGERLTVPLESPMPEFTSRTLNRTFPIIYFVSRVAREGESLAAPAGAPGLAASHGASPDPEATTGAPAAQVDPIPPPAGGLSIADVWAKRQALGGTRVTVRGRVVKVNNGILGHNWLHLQDGSGSAEARTHDITVTTDAVVKAGDVVTVTGVLVLDKDFGAGYAYDAIIEQATVVVAQSAD